eukprot:CAMPEP_0197433082 /NCGR_PEP_ID=MMETSP1175-20131217/1021_1 /TAXON_ID=1003142 /ORGANISM="Triceratium dubium, Strain CCMP147" /LENGTH=799 /DNA_ID=CAMNT_0042961347 /DNA_START=156 /DNA_END=2555 /DNA_ORIENTATION=+
MKLRFSRLLLAASAVSISSGVNLAFAASDADANEGPSANNLRFGRGLAGSGGMPTEPTMDVPPAGDRELFDDEAFLIDANKSASSSLRKSRKLQTGFCVESTSVTCSTNTDCHFGTCDTKSDNSGSTCKSSDDCPPNGGKPSGRGSCTGISTTDTCQSGPAPPTPAPPVLCGTCASNPSQSCQADADCPSVQVCDAKSDNTGDACTSNTQCPPNNGPGNSRGKCETSTTTCNLVTCSPSSSPSSSPSETPTASAAPSASPSSSPTIPPVTSAPSADPSSSPTSPPVTSAPSATPSSNPTSPPVTSAPSSDPSSTPSTAPTTSSKPSIVQGDLAAGVSCSSDANCLSGNCVNGACYASNQCQPLKHDAGSSFDKDQVLLVFVGSGFTDQATWENEANRAFSVFSSYNMFSSTTTQYTALRSTTLQPAFCDYWCNNIERLLCCTISTARTLAADCSPFGANYHVNVQTVVVHNDAKYGGAGYISSNVATTSINSSGPQVAVHELGHSLFELADEYSTGSGTNSRANCDTNTCSKWSDLMGNSAVQNEYGTVSCVAGCNGNSYYVGQVSFMEYLSYPVGAVNDRYTCCAYQALTKSMPPYCNVFDFSADYLFNFCKDNDYQGFGATSYDPAPPVGASPEDEGGSRIQLGDSTLLHIDLNAEGTADQSWGAVSGGGGVFPRKKVKGDYKSLNDASNNGKDQVLQVKVKYATNRQQVFFVETTEEVEIPLIEAGGAGNERDTNVPATMLDLALDAEGEEIVEVQARLMPTRSTRCKASGEQCGSSEECCAGYCAGDYTCKLPNQ